MKFVGDAFRGSSLTARAYFLTNTALFGFYLEGELLGRTRKVTNTFLIPQTSYS